MSSSPYLNPQLIGQFQRSLSSVREGNVADLGALLDFYREYLLTFASRKLSRDLALKIAPSDLVQETLMKASNDFCRFRGKTERELRVWLTKILVRKVIDTFRFYRNSAARDISREVPLNSNEIPFVRDSESELPDKFLERIGGLSATLNRLDNEYQEVIRLHTFERLAFEEVGKRMSRSTDAARKLWTRAILRLAQEFRVHESRTGS